ncbi:hypothetical protein GT350_25030 [Streptomyces sp. SID1034]|nr:hypothetical protein [Streptomyces sp. SID1034]
MIVLLLLLLVGSVLVWILVSLHRADEARDQKSKEGMATMVATAERLRGGLAQKDSDGVLTDREVAEVLNHRPVLSIAREPDRTVLVVRLSADSQVQCYSFTALHTTDVTRRPLDICPPSKPSAPAGHSQ